MNEIGSPHRSEYPKCSVCESKHGFPSLNCIFFWKVNQLILRDEILKNSYSKLTPDTFCHTFDPSELMFNDTL